MRSDLGTRGFSSRPTTRPSTSSTTPKGFGSGTRARPIPGPPDLRVLREPPLGPRARDDDVAVHAEKRAVDVGPQGADRVGRAQAFGLLLVVDREPEVGASAECFADPVALPAD